MPKLSMINAVGRSVLARNKNEQEAQLLLINSQSYGFICNVCNMTGIDVQHTDDDYSRRINFGGLLVGNMAPTSMVQEMESLRG